MKTKILLFLFSSIFYYSQNNSGWFTVYSSEIGKVEAMIIINDPQSKKHNWYSGVYFRTDIPDYVQISLHCNEILLGYDNGKKRNNYFLQSTVFPKATGIRVNDLTSDVRAYQGIYIKYLQIGNQVLFKDGNKVSDFLIENKNSTNNQNISNNRKTFTDVYDEKNFQKVLDVYNSTCKELERVAYRRGGSQLITDFCQGKTWQVSDENVGKMKNAMSSMEMEIMRLEKLPEAGGNSNSSTNSNQQAERQHQQEEQNRIAQEINNRKRQYVSVYNEGVDLGNSGKHSEAAAKYQEAVGLATNEQERQQAQDAYNKISKTSSQIETYNQLGKTSGEFLVLLEENSKKRKEVKELKLHQDKLDNNFILDYTENFIYVWMNDVINKLSKYNYQPTYVVIYNNSKDNRFITIEYPKFLVSFKTLRGEKNENYIDFTIISNDLSETDLMKRFEKDLKLDDNTFNTLSSNKVFIEYLKPEFKSKINKNNYKKDFKTFNIDQNQIVLNHLDIDNLLSQKLKIKIYDLVKNPTDLPSVFNVKKETNNNIDVDDKSNINNMSEETLMTKAEEMSDNENYNESFKYYSIAAERGNSDAMDELGNFYSGIYICNNGKSCIDIDYEKAIFWYNKAIEKGNMQANLSLASMFEKGKGVMKNYSTAVHLFESYYDKTKSKNSAVNIAKLYEEGDKNLKKDIEKAKYWYKIACERGVNVACEKLK